MSWCLSLSAYLTLYWIDILDSIPTKSRAFWLRPEPSSLRQIHGSWAHDLLAAFNAKSQKYLPRLQSAGLTILDVQEWSGQLTFADVGAIVYYLKAVPWFVPSFSVESHVKYLLKLQGWMEIGGVLAFAARKYLIETRKSETASILE
jgi:hypothetical protein